MQCQNMRQMEYPLVGHSQGLIFKDTFFIPFGISSKESDNPGCQFSLDSL